MRREKVFWHNVKEKVAQVSPALAQIINQLDPTHLSLELGTFQYGEEIASFANRSSFLLLDKTCEGFFEFDGKPKTYGLIKPGEMGLTGCLLDLPTPLCQISNWKITAGCRSAFMLPKISDYEFHKKVQKAHNISADKPDEAHAQWYVFKEIAATMEDWQCQVLFFSEDWKKHLKDPAWAQFYTFLLQQYHQHQPYNEQITLLKMIMGIVQKERDVRFSLPHTEDMLYLFKLGLGMVPGFRFASSEDHLPLKLIQKTYLEHYGLEYAPLVVTPDYLNWQNNKESPLYVSFNLPTSYYCSPRVNAALSNARELHQLAWDFKKLQDYILSQNLLTETSTLHQFLLAWDVLFYHKKMDGYARFKPIEQIQGKLPASQWDFAKNKFPLHSPFWQGCASISRKD